MVKHSNTKATTGCFFTIILNICRLLEFGFPKMDFYRV